MIYYYDIAPAIKAPIQKPLTYASDKKLHVGQFVSVQLKSKSVTGVIIRQTTKPKFKTIDVNNILSREPVLPKHLVETIIWLNSFYRAPISSVLKSVLPSGIGKTRRPIKWQACDKQLSQMPLTKAQQSALIKIKSSKSNTWLHGETGSGKTRLYIELVNEAIRSGHDCLVLTPEISLTPQIIEKFSTYSEAVNIFVIHSKITASQKHQIWQAIARSEKPCLVIGTRSATFMPFKKLGLIIVDEAHDSSYKQDAHPKYHTIRVASFISNCTNAKVVFGTATPPVTEMLYAKAYDQLKIVELAEKVFSDQRTIKLIDLTDKSLFNRHRWLSDSLLASIETNLSDNKQSLLLLNKRGTRQNITCNNCGWFAACKNCEVPMRYHHDLHKYLCHICGRSDSPRTSCPDCNMTDLTMKGVGTKQLEIDIKRLFPHARIVRYDQDSLKQYGSHDKIYELILSKKTDIIIGTQLIAKGFDLDRLTTVAAVHADTSLQLPDFSASESTFQMLYQLAGRAGRRGQASEVFLQTFLPKHYAITAAVEHVYDNFYKNEIAHRQAAKLPPFSFLLLLRCKLKTRQSAANKAERLAKDLRTATSLNVLGPSPAFYEYSNGYYHWQVVVNSTKRNNLLRVIDQLPSGWDFELDPINLL